MKKIPYGRQYIDSSDIKEIVKVLKSDWVTQGPKIRDFEEALCGYTGAKYAVAVSSGTAALHVACLAAGIKHGDEVITSPITFLASANCVLYCGGRPVFADVQEDTVNIDPHEIRKHINKKTKAVIPVHFAGHPADMEKIRHIAKKHNLIVIEDACHALGAEYRVKERGTKDGGRRTTDEGRRTGDGDWVKIGSSMHSDMTAFSFHPVKSITTGEGGAVLTNRRDLYEKLLMLRNHGITKDNNRLTVDGSRFTGSWYYEMQMLGFNYRITDIQCALGVSQLRKIDKFLQRRREIKELYNKEFGQIDEITLPKERGYSNSSWHLYVIRLKDAGKRKEVFDRLQKMGISAQVHYIPVYFHPYYRRIGYDKISCPNAEKFYRSAVSIPLYPAIRKSELRYVIDTLKEALEKYA